jgi:hypothetical protein
MLLEKLEPYISAKFQNWQFIGSIVDWHYFGGQIMIKDFDIRTSDPFEPNYVCPEFGPRYSFPAMGRTVDVFSGQVTGRIESIGERVGTLHWLIKVYPDRKERYERLIRRYEKLQQTSGGLSTIGIESKSCPHRGDQVRTMTSDLCGSRGQNLPVFSCAIHGECTHSQVCRGQDPAVRICVGCDDGPWSFR